MIFYILFAAGMFLLPASLVAAELGGAFSKEGGGIYTWVKEAFGSRWGFTAIWLQWIQNVVWYPTVLAFAAGVQPVVREVSSGMVVFIELPLWIHKMKKPGWKT
jgi:amino acid transporter